MCNAFFSFFLWFKPSIYILFYFLKNPSKINSFKIQIFTLWEHFSNRINGLIWVDSCFFFLSYPFLIFFLSFKKKHFGRCYFSTNDAWSEVLFNLATSKVRIDKPKIHLNWKFCAFKDCDTWNNFSSWKYLQEAYEEFCNT